MTTALSEVHRRHLAALAGLPAAIDAEGLRIGTQYTMFFAEADLMRHHATLLLGGVTQPDLPDLLEIGLGLGVFAEQALRIGVGSYTALEAHPGVARLARQRVLPAFAGRARLIARPWQVVDLPAAAFDAIMYDTWPPDGHADEDFASFVEQVALPCLRPGGRFSFFHSGNRLHAARAAVLERHFEGWMAYAYTLPVEQTPPHWTKPTREFLVPIATKAGD
jgi:spermidine synthase